MGSTMCERFATLQTISRMVIVAHWGAENDPHEPGFRSRTRRRRRVEVKRSSLSLATMRRDKWRPRPDHRDRCVVKMDRRCGAHLGVESRSIVGDRDGPCAFRGSPHHTRSEDSSGRHCPAG